MGQTLTRAAQWTRSSEVGRGKLEFTPLNEAILNSIANFVEEFKKNHPEESQVIFKVPLKWHSTLKPSDVLATAGYVRKTDQHVISFNVSEADQRPLMEIKTVKTADRGGTRNLLEVSTVEELANILEISKNNRITEVRECLESNTDPISKMFGDAFATIPGAREDSHVLRFIDSVLTKEMDPNRATEEVAAKRMPAGMNKVSLRLLVLLYQLDMYLMQQSIQNMSGEVRLTPENVENEVSLLSPLSGTDAKTCLLKSIQFTIPIVSQYGCRAPLWRQFHGDICYLDVKPFDTPVIYITCNTAGVFANEGPDPETREQRYNRVGDIYKDLRSLLKAQSTHFNNLLSSEEFSAMINKRIQQELAMRERAPVSKLGGDDASIDMGSLEDTSKPIPPRSRKPKTTRINLPYLDTEEPAIEPRKAVKKRSAPSQKASRHSMMPDLKGKSYWEKLNALLVQYNMTSHDEDISMFKPRQAGFGEEPVIEDSSSEEESEEEEEDDDKDLAFRTSDSGADLPAEYWQIQKVIKYVKAANPTGTVIALIALREFNLTSEYSQRAIREIGGTELFINLLETDEVRCQIASLKILQQISSNVAMCRTVLKLGGLQTMVRLLHDDNKQVTALAAQNIAHMAKFKQVRSMVRQYGGVPQLVKLLKVDKATLLHPHTPLDEDKLEEVRSATQALWGLAVSRQVRMSIKAAGGIPRLAILLRNASVKLLIPVIGILQECLGEESYQEGARKENMIPELVKHLGSSNEELVRLCAYAIFKCAEHSHLRSLVRKHGGLNPLVVYLTSDACARNKRLLAAVTGALWKCAKSPENVALMQEKGVITIFTNMLSDTTEEVIVNVVGALSECSQEPENRVEIYKSGGITQMITLLTHTNHQVLINVCRALKNCALEKKCLNEIEHNDGVRLLWSLLKHPKAEVQASAASAICPCIELLEESGDMVRSFVGGLTLLVKLLNSDSEDVLSSVCATIAIICKDEENLAVLTDNGMVPLLARLTTTPNPRLRRYLAEAIARCSRWGNNRIVLGAEGAVAPLVDFLRGEDPHLLRHTCSALDNLSQDPANCIIMHRSNAVDFLLHQVATSSDHILQEAAASCLANIRQVGLLSDQINIAQRVRK